MPSVKVRLALCYIFLIVTKSHNSALKHLSYLLISLSCLWNQLVPTENSSQIQFYLLRLYYFKQLGTVVKREFVGDYCYSQQMHQGVYFGALGNIGALGSIYTVNYTVYDLGNDGTCHPLQLRCFWTHSVKKQAASGFSYTENTCLQKQFTVGFDLVMIFVDNQKYLEHFKH